MIDRNKKITRRGFLRGVGGLVVAGGAMAPALTVFGKGAGAGRPNVVLIIGDDISDSDFGCYGHPHIRTPHVDKLAADGMRFTNAYLTTSQCSPTRCSLITGRYPWLAPRNLIHVL